MRTEVIRPGPPKRLRTVVLREGPPKGRRAGIDMAFGIAGALLLILAGTLVVALPEKDILLPQFEVKPTQTRVNHTFDDGTKSPTFQVAEGSQHTLEVVVPFDNVNNIIVDLRVEDDVVASLPDVFSATLTDPLGRLQEDAVRFQTGEPMYDPETLNFATGFVDVRLNFGIGQPPEGGFVAGARENVTAEQVHRAYLEQYFIPSAGTWLLEVSLTSAGDCPGPQDVEPGTEGTMRIALCRQGSDGQDTGNAVTLEAFQYTYFDVDVSEL